MAFTHGMNLEEVRGQSTEMGTIHTDLGTIRGEGNDTINEFVEADWWGDDATRFLQTWMDTVDKAFDVAMATLEQLTADLNTNIADQEATSAS